MARANRGDKIDSQRSSILTIGGYVAICAGIVGIIGGFYYIGYRDSLVTQYQSLALELGIDLVVSGSLFMSIGIAAIISGLCAIVGGRYALWKKRFMVAVLFGGVFSFIASFLILSLIGAIFGILPFIFIIKSKNEFV
jgi:hypothetical protein